MKEESTYGKKVEKEWIRALREKWSSITIAEFDTHTVYTIWENRDVYAKVLVTTKSVGGRPKEEVDLHELLSMFFQTVGFIVENNGLQALVQMRGHEDKFGKVIFRNKIMNFAEVQALCANITMIEAGKDE